MDVSAWEVRGGLGQRYRGHVMCLEFIPVRNIVQQSRLQLYQDLREDSEGKGEGGRRVSERETVH